MATVKITELPILTHLSANNANTVFVAVDKTTNTTSQFSTTTLAAGLYENNVLNVGTSDENLNPNVIAQFISNTANYSQIWVQNINEKGSGDFVITADNGDDSNNYIDMGIQGSAMNHSHTFDLANNDGYLYVQGKSGTPHGNLWIGTGEANTDVVVFLGGTIQANETVRFNKNGLKLKSKPVIFADDTTQNTAAVTAAHSQVIFNQANSAYNFAIDVNTYTASIYTLANTQSNSISVIQGVNITQNADIITANNHAWSAFDKANTNASDITIIQGVNTTQNTSITTANNHAWAAYDKANTALANTTGIFDGTLTITGDLNFDGTASLQSTDDMFIGSSAGVQIQTDNGGTQKQFQFGTDGSLTIPDNIIVGNTEFNSLPSASPAVFMISTANAFGIQANTHEFLFGADGSLTVPHNFTATGNGLFNVSSHSNTIPGFIVNASISGNPLPVTGAAAALGGYTMQIVGRERTALSIDGSSNTSTSYPSIIGRRTRGTVDNPLPVANNDVLFRIATNGYASDGFSNAGGGRVDFVAAQNFTPTARGSRIEFYNVPNNSNTIQKIASFNANTVEFFGTVNPTKGFVYTPNVISSGAATLTLDFERDSWIKANSSTGLTVSFTNYVSGKEVIVWFQNNSGSTQTVTHGCLANNSTTGGTSFTVPGNQTVLMRYFSLDAASSDVYVAVTK